MSGMKSLMSIFSICILTGLMLFGFVGAANAQNSRRSERETRDTVRNLKSKIDDFQYNLTNQLQNSSADQSEVTEIDGYLRDLTAKIDGFENNLDQKRENRDDVSVILDSAQIVNNYLSQNQQNRKFQNDWTSIRTLLDRLAVSYNVQHNWNGSNGTYDNSSSGNNYPNNNRHPNQNNRPDQNNRPANNFPSAAGLTGTYQLDASRSENTSDVLADSNITNDDQRRAIQDTLESPEQIAIDVRGNQVTMASSKISPNTYTADGRDQSRQTPDGKTVRLRVTLNNQQLTLSSDSGATNYSTTFVSTDGGQTLKVTRSLTTDYLNQTIFVDSIYRKTESVARLGISGGSNNTSNDAYNGSNNSDNNSSNGDYSSSDSTDRNNSGSNYPNGSYPSSNRRSGNFVVPNGTIITGNLDGDINTNISQNNDRFRMTVQSPDQFRGATIEGYLTGVSRSGKVSGSSQVTFNFERITLRDGQSYDFAGFLQNVRDQDGKNIKVDQEGTAHGDSQTKQTVKRGSIGGGIGAVIGAIAGGAHGAVIGAVIGSGAGAGSVAVQGKDDLELKQGSSITVQASAPSR